MAISTAEIATAVVSPAISIIRRTRKTSAACSGVGSGKTVSVMQSSSQTQGSSTNGSSQTGAGRLDVIVAGDEGSVRLDRVLAVRQPTLSRSRLKGLILAGSVSIRTPAIRGPAYHVRKGHTNTIHLPQPLPAQPQPENIARHVHHEH